MYFLFLFFAASIIHCHFVSNLKFITLLFPDGLLFAPQLWSFNKPELLNSQIFCFLLYDFSVENYCFSPVSFFSSYLSEPCYKHLPSSMCLLKLCLGRTLLVSVCSYRKSKIHFVFSWCLFQFPGSWYFFQCELIVSV